MAAFKDYYEMLGVGRDASQDDIKRAYRKLAAKHHPDRNPGDEAAEDRFKEINEAYTVLADPEKRKVYDQYGTTGQVPPQGAWGGAPGGGRVHVDADSVGDFSEFFQSLFGGGFGGFGGARGGGFTTRTVGGDPFRGDPMGGDPFGAGRVRHEPRPRTVEANLEIELERAYRGGDVPISVDGTRVTVTVPPGARDGAKLRLRGQAPGGGDLILIVRHRPHPEFTVRGDTVRTELHIPDHLAALGGKARAPTLDGPVDVTVPAGSSTGRTLRLRGQGWPKRGGGRGDQLVELQVTVPEHPTEEQKRAYRKLQAIAEGKAATAA